MASSTPAHPVVPRPVTLRDVANEVGVSVATVSYVLNGKRLDRVSEATRNRVHQASQRLGYRPNATARSLVSGRSRCIGIYVAEPINQALDDGTSALLIRGIVQHCAEANYGIQMAIQGSELPAFPCDAWICLSAGEKVSPLHFGHKPTVFIEPNFTPESPALVAQLNLEAVQKLVHQALGSAPKELAMVCTGPDCLVRCNRLHQLAEHLPFDNATTYSDLPIQDDGDSLLAWYDRNPYFREADAILAPDDMVALRIRQLLRQRNRRCPQEVQLLSLCSTGLAELLEPQITSLDLHLADYGQSIAKSILSSLDGEQKGPIELPKPPEPTLKPGITTLG